MPRITKAPGFVWSVFAQVDSDDSDSLDFQEFLTLVRKLRHRPEVAGIWSLLASMAEQQRHEEEKEEEEEEGSPSPPPPPPSPSPPLAAPLLPPPQDWGLAALRLGGGGGGGGGGGDDGDANSKGSSSGPPSLPIETFHAFLTQVQGEDPALTLQDAKALLARVSPTYDDDDDGSDGGSSSSFTMEDLTSYLKYGTDIVDRSHTRKVHQDMSQPLEDYYIASSHNTYLDGDQLQSNSSVSRYILDLESGCRCVEIDCWDGEGGEPRVHHGKTLTSSVHFKDVIAAIASSAFTASRYPVILSFENHCSIPQQRRMAHHLRTILGDKLALPPPPSSSSPPPPSPESLRGKVLVKAKKRPLHHDDSDHHHEAAAGLPLRSSSSSSSATQLPGPAESLLSARRGSSTEEEPPPPPPLPSSRMREGGSSTTSSPAATVIINNGDNDSHLLVKPSISNCSLSSSTSTSASSSSGGGGGGGSSSSYLSSVVKSTKKTFAKELADITWMEGVKFKSWNPEDYYPGITTTTTTTTTHCCMSIKEPQMLRWLEQPGGIAEKWAALNRHMFTRIYPGNHRIDSSNYSPIPVWNVGAQMAALNYQTPGLPMQINTAKFSENGSCGYVLKPPYLRGSSSGGGFDPVKGPFPTPPLDLTITILSAQQLPRPSSSTSTTSSAGAVSPYVKVQTLGVPADERTEVTKPVSNNAFNPVWWQQKGQGPPSSSSSSSSSSSPRFTFRLRAPELAFLSLGVWSKSSVMGMMTDEYIASVVLPVTALRREGFRRVQLYSKCGKKMGEYEHASLLVHITMTTATTTTTPTAATVAAAAAATTSTTAAVAVATTAATVAVAAARVATTTTTTTTTMAATEATTAAMES